MQRIMVLGIAIALGAVACNDVLPVPPGSHLPRDTTVHAVVVRPASATVKVGGQVQLAVSVDAGAWVTDRTVVWSSSNAMIASVSATGLVTSGSITGVATITATSKVDTTVKGSSTITVGSEAATNLP